MMFEIGKGPLSMNLVMIKKMDLPARFKNSPSEFSSELPGEFAGMLGISVLD